MMNIVRNYVTEIFKNIKSSRVIYLHGLTVLFAFYEAGFRADYRFKPNYEQDRHGMK